jgi:protein phosphatase
MRLFKKRTAQAPSLKDHDTRPTVPVISSTERPTRPTPPATCLEVAKTSHIGLVRERNEDSFVTLEFALFAANQLVPVGVYIIADGMGGHQKGDAASSLAARVAANRMVQDVVTPFLASEEPSSQQLPINEALAKAVEAANAAVCQQLPEAGTTLLIAVTLGHQVYLANVGDSRAYIFDQGALRQITQDHSLVARLVELGHSTPDQALRHAHRGVLYRAIGQTELAEVDTYLQQLPAGGTLLLCTDGLWDKVPDKQIADILSQATSPQQALDRLVAAANQSGGDDNITAILVTHGAAF